MSGPIRVALVGDSGVGKTTLLQRWAYDRIVHAYEPTLEDTANGLVTIANQIRAVEAIDTPGNEDFASIRDSYLRECDAMIFVYDVTRPDSLRNVRETYWPAAQQTRSDDVVPCILVGNKTDCVEDRQVTPREGEDLAQEMRAVLLEMSIIAEDGKDQVTRAMAEAAARGHRARTPRIILQEKKSCGCVLS